MINVQHNRTCSNCQCKQVTCVLYLVTCVDDKGDEFDSPFFLCMKCLSEAATAVVSAMYIRDKVSP